MKIVIDYRLAASSYRGMARYCREITNELIKNKPNDWSLIIFIDKNFNKNLLPKNTEHITIPTKNYIIGEQIWIPYYLYAIKPDIIWCPSNTFPLISPRQTKKIATIHDLIFMNKVEDKENLYQKIGRLYRKFTISTGIKKLDACCTVSQFTKKEIIKRFNIHNITVTYNCIDHFYYKANAIKISQDINKDENLFFTVSGDAPSKNLSFLFKWFNNNTQYKLVVAGLPTNSRFRNNCPNNITILPHNISEQELIKNYLKAKTFLFVSKQEGFGIPILEAMICNCKIIASDRTSIPEIAGKDTLYINPDDLDSLSRAVENLKNFEIDEQYRKEHLQQFFKWENSAQKLIKQIKTLG